MRLLQQIAMAVPLADRRARVEGKDALNTTRDFINHIYKFSMIFSSD
jgi:hypothetical protein